MRLLHAISLRFSLLAAVIMAFWAVLFYFALIEEVNDETDDSLEDYAELIIRRSLAGERLPDASSGPGSQYRLREVTAQYAAKHSPIRYSDRDVYIAAKRKRESARTLFCIYRDGDGRFFELEASVTTIEKSDLKESIFYWMAALYAVIVLGAALLNWFAVRRTMRPLQVLLNWLDGYRLSGERRELHNPTRITELQRLNEAAVRSMRRNEELFEQQKMFIGNASHEMQTPLAVCQNRLEMLLEDGSLTERQMNELGKTLATLDSLSKLNRSLLMLCKIDNGQYADSGQVDMTALASGAIDDCASVFAGKWITVEQRQGGYWTLDINRTMAETLITNLVKNAFLHNTERGRVVVATSSDGVSIANTGVEEPLDTEKIFTRFYHTGGSKSSTGLGLPLVKAVCSRYGIRIGYSFEDGLHTFRLRK